MGNPLARSNGNPPHSFLGDALKFAIGAAGGPFVDALEIGGVAAAIVKQAIPALAAAVGNSVSKSGPSGPDSLATASFVTDYAHAVKEHHAIVTQRLESAIHNVQDGKDIVGALGGEKIAGRLQLTSGQEGRVRLETQKETLDAWTVAMQKTGDKDEFGHDDKTAAAMFYDQKSLFPVTSDEVKKDDAIVDRDYRKGLHKIWNIIHDQTPHQLGFSTKGD
ncbi:MAG TPA: hypothetical protein VF516_25435 [Kofleriaceae bacterium]